MIQPVKEFNIGKPEHCQFDKKNGFVVSVNNIYTWHKNISEAKKNLKSRTQRF